MNKNNFDTIEVYINSSNFNQLFLLYNIAQEWDKVIIIEIDGKVIRQILYGNKDNRCGMSEIVTSVLTSPKYNRVDGINKVNKINEITEIVSMAFDKEDRNELLESLIEDLSTPNL